MASFVARYDPAHVTVEQRQQLTLIQREELDWLRQGGEPLKGEVASAVRSVARKIASHSPRR